MIALLILIFALCIIRAFMEVVGYIFISLYDFGLWKCLVLFWLFLGIASIVAANLP